MANWSWKIRNMGHGADRFSPDFSSITSPDYLQNSKDFLHANRTCNILQNSAKFCGILWNKCEKIPRNIRWTPCRENCFVYTIRTTKHTPGHILLIINNTNNISHTMNMRWWYDNCWSELDTLKQSFLFVKFLVFFC